MILDVLFFGFLPGCLWRGDLLDQVGTDLADDRTFFGFYFSDGLVCPSDRPALVDVFVGRQLRFDGGVALFEFSRVALSDETALLDVSEEGTHKP